MADGNSQPRSVAENYEATERLNHPDSGVPRSAISMLQRDSPQQILTHASAQGGAEVD